MFNYPTATSHFFSFVTVVPYSNKSLSPSEPRVHWFNEFLLSLKLLMLSLPFLTSYHNILHTPWTYLPPPSWWHTCLIKTKVCLNTIVNHFYISTPRSECIWKIKCIHKQPETETVMTILTWMTLSVTSSGP